MSRFSTKRVLDTSEQPLDSIASSLTFDPIILCAVTFGNGIECRVVAAFDCWCCTVSQ